MTQQSTWMPGRIRLAAGIACVVAVLIAGLATTVAPAFAATPISGQGSTFAGPEIQQWEADVSPLPVSFTANGSGDGRDSYAQGTAGFGVSDIIYYAADAGYVTQAEQQHPFNYVTVSAGGLAFMYNIVINGQRFSGLELTPQDVCKIFTGQLTKWSQLASTPGDEALANVTQSIVPVTRQDAAGESYVLSQYCIADDNADWTTFKNFVDSNTPAEDGFGWAGDPDMAQGLPIENWPPAFQGGGHPLDANGAIPAQADVENPANGFTIGYMAADYAIQAGLPVAAVENSAGQFVLPTSNNAQIALSYAAYDPTTRTFKLNFAGPSPQAYFPSTYSYAIAPTTTNAPVNAGADSTLAQFLCYAVGAGQQKAAPLGYAPLSQQVTQLSVNAIQGIPGARAVPNCGVGGPEPNVVAPGHVVVNPNPPPPTAPSGGNPGSPGSPGAPAVTAPPTTTPSGPVTAPPSGPATTAPPTASQTTVAVGQSGSGGTTANPAAIGNGGAGSNSSGSRAASGLPVGGSASNLPCGSTTTTSSTSTSSTTTRSEAGAKANDTTTTTSKATTTTTAPKGSTTTKPGAKGSTTTTSTTSTTLCTTTKSASGLAGTSLAGGTAQGGSGGSLASGTPGLFGGGTGPGGVVSPTTVQIVSSPASQTTTNSQAYWYLLVGAAVCAVGVGAAELRRRPAR